MAGSEVSFVLPGLIWPGQGIGSAIESLNLPALATLAGSGRVERGPGQTWLRYLSRQWGAEALDWAALRLTGERETTEAVAPGILCADPVSLGFSSDALILRGPREVALSPQEATELISTLNAEFSDAGQWLMTSPAHFYLLPHADPDTSFHPLDDVLGRPVAYFQPEGPRAREYARLSNELQVCLHNHPVNMRRREQGLLNANGIWLWGESPASLNPLLPPAAHVFSNDPIVTGLARRAGCSRLKSPDEAFSGRPGHSWVHDDRALLAARDGDFAGWTDALSVIDRELLQPAIEGWQKGRINELRLLAPSDKGMLQITLPRIARWAFWRRPADRKTLAGLLQSA
ncbi:hypothetical protein ACFONG_08705 [Uliginosibacterium paludis]|uniref:Phosphoglycerate mutase n=1 Tax=Uliginosibacterium paludis TaxID=1615952 RepID=A0ABV2CK70_9RHOO